MSSRIHINDWIEQTVPLRPSPTVMTQFWLYSGREEATEVLKRMLLGPAAQRALQRHALKEAQAAEAAGKPKEKTVVRRRGGLGGPGKKKRRRRR